MYRIDHRTDVIRIPPDKLTGDLQGVCEDIARETFECRVEGKNSLVLLVRNVRPLGHGKVVHGDGAVYQHVEFDSLLFDVGNDEVVCGTVVGVIKFGAFIRIGPLDGLLHISQIIDDRISVDESSQRLLGKETKRDLKLGDEVRARIVYVKDMDELSPRQTKIGLTMRQSGLGKLAWLEEERAPPPPPKEKKKKKKTVRKVIRKR